VDGAERPAVTQADPPTLTTARLTLRPLTGDDVDALARIYPDPEITRYFRAPVPDRDAVAALVLRRLSRPLGPGLGSWVFVLGGEVVGIGHVWPSAELPGAVPEMGWLLARPHWGRGLAGEAARAIRDHALLRVGEPAVWALVHRDNAASQALARRLGLLAVGEGHHHGGPHTVFVGLPPTAGALHHVELWVADLAATEESLGWLLGELGWRVDARWRGGVSWRRGATYVVAEDSPDRVGDAHERRRPGLNHLALHAGDRARVDELTKEAVARGWRLLFADRHPHAGGDAHYAAYLEDSAGFEVELVAAPPPLLG
jgi:RimJ/RimL family protein N-acetyltransferase/catechol 2,3-dioxygenase-like lactoylglutathione lyase family enzyme